MCFIPPDITEITGRVQFSHSLAFIGKRICAKIKHNKDDKVLTKKL
jgi:hypothetical protein